MTKAGAEDSGVGSGKALAKTGAIGATVMAVCCFTPILVIGFGAVGLSAWLGWIDYVLFPALFGFLGLLAFGLWRIRTQPKA